MLNFQGILGHAREIGILRKSISSGRVAHALLFAGPEGIGKRLVARAFAKALNCASGNDDACEACRDCLAFDSASHPNLLEIWPTDKDGEKDPLGLIRIGQVREIQGILRFKAESGKKVIIVEGAERFMPQAANAFLKTLEEPPPDSLIILVTSKPSDLLPTVLSRCQRVSFGPLSEDDVRAFLIKNNGISPAEAGAVARLSEGSISRASAYIEDGAYQLRRELVERLSHLGPAEGDEALKLAEELSKRDDLDDVLEFLKSWYRDRIVAFEGSPHLIANTDLQRNMKDSGVEDFNRLCSDFWAIEEAKKGIAPPRNGNKQLTMEVLLLKLSGAHFM